MESKLPISVFIIAKNEDDRIDKPILSVRDFVDEILVIDSGSTDNTVAFSKSLGAKVTFNQWEGYGQQKIFGESLCKNDWILNLDADEELSPELANNIKQLFASSDINKFSAYKIYWKLLFRLEKKPPIFATGSSFIRLYNKKYSGFRDSIVHDSVVVKEGDIGLLKGYVYHRCFKSLDHWCGKINSYSTMQATDIVSKNRKISSIRIIIEPFFAFFKAYILRRYFLYGVDGFVGSFLYAYARMIRLAKAREIYNTRLGNIS